MIRNIVFSKKGAVGIFILTALVFLLRPFMTGQALAPFDFHEHFYNTLNTVENYRQTGAFHTGDFSPAYALFLFFLTGIIPSTSVWFFFFIRLFIVLCGFFAVVLLNRLLKILRPDALAAEIFFADTVFIMLYAKDSTAATGSFLIVPVLLAAALSFYKTLTAPSVATGVMTGALLSFSLFVQWDAFLFAVTLVLVFYLQFNGKTPVTYRLFFKILTGFVIGLLPAAGLYYVQKDTFPSSYLLWQSVQDHEPWLVASLFLWYPIRYFIRMPLQLVYLTFPIILCGLGAFVSFPKDVKKSTGKDTVFWTLVWYPLLWVLCAGMLTYIDLPVYAFYPFAIGAPFALAAVVEKIYENQKDLENEKLLLNRYCLVMAGVCLLVAFLQILTPSSAAYKPLTAAAGVFFEKNPSAVYAMGKGAGIAAYFNKKTSVIRVDGYAAPAGLIDDIRQSHALGDVLRRLNADFYIALTTPEKKDCTVLREPVKTFFGPNNRATDGWACVPPVAETPVSKNLVLRLYKTSDLQIRNK